jgi:hypothetical protein
VTKASEVYFTGATRDERAALNSKNPAYIIARDVEIAGWLGQNDFGPEDWHWSIMVDPDFIAARYGAGSPVANAMLPGHVMVPSLTHDEDPVPIPSQRLPFADMTTDGRSRGVTINSFVLTQVTDAQVMGAELDAWFVKDETRKDWQGKSMSFHGRGQPPASWVQDKTDPNVYWPFDPYNVDGKGPLVPGEYVILHGTLWQDGGHLEGWFCSVVGGLFCMNTDNNPNHEQNSCWNKGQIPPDPPAWPQPRYMAPHGGWLEIHPVDAIHRSSPAVRPARSARFVAICAPVEAADASRSIDAKLSPTESESTKPGPGYVLRVEELIDGRFTDMRTVDEHSVRVVGDTVLVHVKVHSSGTLSFQGKEGRFKAGYILSWAPPPPPLRQMIASITPSLITRLGSTAVKVHAEDAVTHAPVAATVKVNGVAKGATDVSLAVAACTRPGAPKGEIREIQPARITVTAPGYAETGVTFDCKGAQ